MFLLCFYCYLFHGFLLFIVSFFLLALYLVCSYFSSFIKWNIMSLTFFFLAMLCNMWDRSSESPGEFLLLMKRGWWWGEIRFDHSFWIGRTCIQEQ